MGRGTTPKARWILYARRARFGGFCTGLQMKPPDGSGLGPSGEGCGGGLRGEPLTLASTYGRHRGTFATGMASTRVAAVKVTFGDEEPVDALLLPSPPALGFAGQFWIAPFPGLCMRISAEAFDAQGTSLAQVGIPPRTGPPFGPRRRCRR